jgi:hypothetical protein
MIQENLQLSAKAQGEHLLNGIRRGFPTLFEASPKTVLTLHRIV